MNTCSCNCMWCTKNPAKHEICGFDCTFVKGVEEMKYPEHICRFNDHPQVCDCYDEAMIKVRSRIGFLRQWLNEKPADQLVTNEDIEYWLEL